MTCRGSLQAPTTLNLRPLGVRVDNLATATARDRDYQPLQLVAGCSRISVRSHQGSLAGQDAQV